MRRYLPPLLVVLAGLFGCQETTSPPDTVSGAQTQALAPELRLQRASMLLRGQRPSLAEYERLRADPGAYDALVDEYLASPAFGATVRQLFTEWLELDQAPDTYPAGFPAIGPLEGLGTNELNRSVIQAAGRLAEHIVMGDHPWTEIVTADYTMADGIVATVWGLPYDYEASPDGSAWQRTEYTDGRPRAGVLSDGWVFTRMPSTEGNRHRERASLIAGTFICHDYPNRPVVIPPDVELASEEAVANAVETNPVCQSCHHSMDPLASFFAVHHGLRYPASTTEYPLVQYTPQEVDNYEPPSWYGTPATDLSDMGRLVAEDPRFSSCMVRRFYSEMMHLGVEEVPIEVVQHYEPLFRNGFNVRALLRDIVLSQEFAATTAEGAREGLEDPAVGFRKATPQQLEHMFQELTGYRWSTVVPFELESGAIGEVALLSDPLFGYRTLAGGPNGFDTITQVRTVTPSTLLVLSAVAERAARHVVASDTDPATARLLRIPGARDGNADAVRQQLQQLYLRLFGLDLPADSPELQRAVALYESADNPTRAWELTLAALFQDPRILLF